VTGATAAVILLSFVVRASAGALTVGGEKYVAKQHKTLARGPPPLPGSRQIFPGLPALTAKPLQKQSRIHQGRAGTGAASEQERG